MRKAVGEEQDNHHVEVGERKHGRASEGIDELNKVHGEGEKEGGQRCRGRGRDCGCVARVHFQECPMGKIFRSRVCGELRL